MELKKTHALKKCKTKNIIKNAVYLNILNEELDFIGKFENLKNDVQYISHKLNKKIILPRLNPQIMPLFKILQRV